MCVMIGCVFVCVRGCVCVEGVSGCIITIACVCVGSYPIVCSSAELCGVVRISDRISQTSAGTGRYGTYHTGLRGTR